MKKTIFENQKIISILNETFYFITLNREEKEDITFLGKTFVYQPAETHTGNHELADALASKKGIVSCPTSVFLNSKFEIELQFAAYISSKKMMEILSKF